MDTTLFIDFILLKNVPPFFVVAGQSFGLDVAGSALILFGFSTVLYISALILLARLMYAGVYTHITAIVSALALLTLLVSAASLLLMDVWDVTGDAVDNIAAVSAGISGILMITAARMHFRTPTSSSEKKDHV